MASLAIWWALISSNTCLKRKFFASKFLVSLVWFVRQTPKYGPVKHAYSLGIAKGAMADDDNPTEQQNGTADSEQSVPNSSKIPALGDLVRRVSACLPNSPIAQSLAQAFDRLPDIWQQPENQASMLYGPVFGSLAYEPHQTYQEFTREELALETRLAGSVATVAWGWMTDGFNATNRGGEFWKDPNTVRRAWCRAAIVYDSPKITPIRLRNRETGERDHVLSLQKPAPVPRHRFQLSLRGCTRPISRVRGMSGPLTLRLRTASTRFTSTECRMPSTSRYETRQVCGSGTDSGYHVRLLFAMDRSRS